MVDVLQKQVCVQVFLTFEVGLARATVLLRGFVNFELSLHLAFIFLIAELHEGLMLGESEVLQVVWIAHIHPLDLQV